MRLSGSGAILTLLPFFLGWLSLVTASSAVADDATNFLGKRCKKPQVRREWRALSDAQRAEWIAAVKVILCFDGLAVALPELAILPAKPDNQFERSVWQKSRTRNMSFLTQTT